jgi:hypothetical protein
MEQFASWFTHGVTNGSHLRTAVYEPKSAEEVFGRVEFFEKQLAAITVLASVRPLVRGADNIRSKQRELAIWKVAPAHQDAAAKEVGWRFVRELRKEIFFAQDFV